MFSEETQVISKISTGTMPPQNIKKLQIAPWGTNLAIPPTKDEGEPPLLAGETLGCAHRLKMLGTHPCSRRTSMPEIGQIGTA